jgi:hypothetical protein
MRWSFPIFAMLLLSSAPAQAGVPCGDITSDGLCRDSKTLVFCDDGTLETLTCPAGEVCTTDDRFGGAAGCIATMMAGCGDVPEVGTCAGPETLVFCDNRAIVERRCPIGTRCSWVAAEGWYDCVVPDPNGAEGPETPAPETPEPPPAEPTEPANPDSENGDAARMSPEVSGGGAPAAGEFIAGGSGCSGGVGAGWVLAFFGLLGARLRRRG